MATRLVTSAALAAALGRILESESVPTLTALAAELRRANPGDFEVETVARQAELKRTRIQREN